MNEDQKPIDMPDTLAEAERFKRLFIDPAVQAMGQQMEAHLQPVVSGQRKLFAQLAEHKEEAEKKDKEQDDRLQSLEGKQMKAMVGWGVFATGLSIALSASWDWIKRKLGWTSIILLVLLAGCTSSVQVVSLTSIRGAGSGFVLSDGKIMTAAHVVEVGSLTAHVGPTTMPTSQPVVSGDRDTATLDAPVHGHARIRSPRVGERVTIRGFVYESISHRAVPIETEGKVLAGPIFLYGQQTYLIQGAAGPGMSGCPVIGSDGAVVGVISGSVDGSDTLVRIGPMREE